MGTEPARAARISATTNVLTLLCAMYFINYIVRVNVSTASAAFQPELHLTSTQVGLVSAATVMMGLANSLSALVFARVLLGVGVAALPVATRAMSAWTPVEERGFAQGITHSSHVFLVDLMMAGMSGDEAREARPHDRSGCQSPLFNRARGSIVHGQADPVGARSVHREAGHHEGAARSGVDVVVRKHQRPDRVTDLTSRAPRAES